MGRGTEQDFEDIEVSLNGFTQSASSDSSEASGGPPIASLQSCESFVCQKDPRSGRWICKPYKAQLLQREIDKANEVSGDADSHNRIIERLKQLGVRVFVIPCTETEEMFAHIRRIIKTVARESNRGKPGDHLERSLYERPDAPPQSCLLYQDRQGRLFNLTIDDSAVGIASRWKDLLETFSGFQAMVALTVLARSFPCASADETDSLKPAYLSLILGLVFTEELSLPWLNTSMLVRGMPSISAYALTNKVGSDWARKLAILSLSMAGAATGEWQRGLTLFGVALSCIIFLVNLGSRAWYFLKWRPLQYDGYFSSLFALAIAMLTGIAMPYIGYTEVQMGGKAAIEHITISALLVGGIFILSDYNKVQQFIIVGSETCNQDVVNIVVGSWFAVTLATCLCLVRRVPRYQQWPDDDAEPLLEEDQSSPVGFRVPNLPVFPVKPGLAKNGIKCCTVTLEMMIGMIIAFGVGGLIVYTAFVEWDDDLANGEFDGF